MIDDLNDKDRREMERLMNEEVLEISKYPEILYDAAFVSVRRLDNTLFAATLNGNLSLHGVTHGLPANARVAEFGEMLRASEEFVLKQADYGIKPISVAGGALKVKDELSSRSKWSQGKRTEVRGFKRGLSFLPDRCRPYCLL